MMFSFLFLFSDLFSPLQKLFTPGFLQFHNDMMWILYHSFMDPLSFIYHLRALHSPFILITHTLQFWEISFYYLEKSSSVFSQFSLELILFECWFSGTAIIWVLVLLLFGVIHLFLYISLLFSSLSPLCSGRIFFFCIDVFILAGVFYFQPFLSCALVWERQLFGCMKGCLGRLSSASLAPSRLEIVASNS